MSAHADRPRLRLLSLNVNGLANLDKRRNLFAALIKGPWDVVCLQETHQRASDDGNQWAQTGAAPGQPWPGWSFWRRGPTAAATGPGDRRRCATAGVAVLIRESCGCTNVAEVAPSTDDGRRLRIDFSLHGHLYSVITAYTPCDQHPRLAFLPTLASDLPTDSRRSVLLCGDFNCIDTIHDATPIASERSGRLVGGAQLQHLTAAAGLADAWRHCHPHPATDFSFVSRNADHGASRLDYWLVAEALLQHQPHSAIIDDFDSDHRAVTFAFTLPGAVLRARPPWRFPLSLLADNDFVDELKDALDRPYG